VVFLLDLQEIRQLEDDLKQRQTLFSALVQEMPHIVFVCNSKGCMRQFNERFYELTGVVPSADNGFAWRDAIHEADHTINGTSSGRRLWLVSLPLVVSLASALAMVNTTGTLLEPCPWLIHWSVKLMGLLKITIENAVLAAESCSSRSSDSKVIRMVMTNGSRTLGWHCH
jgi:hypothetical protein